MPKSRCGVKPIQVNFWKSFGPGILFAGAAIGTSHLVQSTRAGAMFGLGLLLVVIAANLIKYPAYRFGPLYAAITGRSLIDGYHGLGRWVLILYIASVLAVFAIVIAATALVTAAILLAVSGVAVDARHAGVALIVAGTAVLVIGGFNLLDKLTKVFVLILTLATFVATLLSLSRIDWSLSQFALPDMDIQTYAFVIALMGFMPSGMDLSVVQSLWCVAKSRASGKRLPLPHVLTDFNIGYVGSAFLAVCFLLMGAGVMYADGIVPETRAAGFATQVIALYTATLGGWSGTVVGVSALFVMFTTLITILDGMPRLVAAGIVALQSRGQTGAETLDRSPILFGSMAVLAIAGALVLLFFMKSFQTFIDFVTISAFIVAPLTALLNHLVIISVDVPAGQRPHTAMLCWSLFAILALSGLAIAFLYWRFLG